MEGTHATFAAIAPPPKQVPVLNSYVFKFEEQTVQQAVLLKLARVITGLRAAHLLIDNGFLQEASTLQRTVDEAQEDTIFLVYGTFLKRWTDLHDKYLKSFWHEDFLSRPTIARPKIRDYIAEREATFGKASAATILEPAKQIYKLYSGYAHASAANVMELYDGQPPSWMLKGSIGTRFQFDQAYDIRNQYFRGATAFAFAALIFENPTIFASTMKFVDQFMRGTDIQQPKGR